MTSHVKTSTLIISAQQAGYQYNDGTQEIVTCNLYFSISNISDASVINLMISAQPV